MTAMGLGLDIVYAAAGLLSSPVWAARLLRTGKWRTDWSARFGRCELPADDRPTLLIHAVSVGEINAIRQLADQLRQRDGDRMRLVISAATNTGIARARELYEPNIPVVRFPLDFTASVARFLDAVRPNVVALVELEVWPNFITACQKRGAAVCVINGRLSPNSFRNYRLGRAFVRPTFAKLAAAAVQTEQYARRFRELGAPAEAVQVLDTMKWDTATIQEPGDVEGAAELAEALGLDRSKPVIVAGSTGPGEEKLLIDTCPADAQLILVPRHPERFNEVAALNAGIVRRTGGEAKPSRLYLLDTMGELRKAYALADVALVGRSFLGMAGSDPLEPIALGKPTATGPHYGNFVEMVDTLKAAGGLEVTAEPGVFAAKMLEDREAAKGLAECGREVIRSRQGATKRHADLLLSMMELNDAVN